MSMMDEIKMKKKLKSAASRGVKEPAKPAASTGPMSMMDEIKMKRKLKSVKDRAPKVLWRCKHFAANYNPRNLTPFP